MGQAGWLDRFGPPSLLVSSAIVLAVIFPTAIAAGPPRSNPAAAAKSCADFDLPAVAAAAVSVAPSSAVVARDAVLDSAAVLTGWRLEIRTSAGSAVTISLPPESFVADARGEVVVYGYDDGSASVVRAVSTRTGCDVLLSRPAEVVRSALLDATGSSLYVHSVTRQTREDAGVKRHDLSSGSVELVVEPLPAAAEFGPTFATELHWSVEGEALAVQSCGASACRTRVLDIATGAHEAYDRAHGALIGLTESALVAFAGCDWAPCPVVAIRRGGGSQLRLADEVLSASLALRGGRAVLTMETPAGEQEVLP